MHYKLYLKLNCLIQAMIKAYRFTRSRLGMTRSFSSPFDHQDDDALISMNVKQLNDYRWRQCVDAMRSNDKAVFDSSLYHLRGLRQGMTHMSSTYMKFAGMLESYLPKLTEAERSKAIDHLYHIGIKDPQLWKEIYRFIRQNFEYDSYNALVSGLTVWTDNDLYGHKLLLEDSYKKSFLDKTRSLLKKMSPEDLVRAAYIADSWNVEIEPLIEKLRFLDYDNMNSKKILSLNTYPKLAYLMAKHNSPDKTARILEMISISTTVAYDQVLQGYELNSPHDFNIGVHDPLHWKSIGLYARSMILSKIVYREYTQYLDDAISRKAEVQVCDISDGTKILRDMREVIGPANRVKIVQMMNRVATQEPELIAVQLTPERLYDLMYILTDEARHEQLSTGELRGLTSAIGKMILDGDFDGHLADMHEDIDKFIGLVVDCPDHMLADKDAVIASLRDHKDMVDV